MGSKALKRRRWLIRGTLALSACVTLLFILDRSFPLRLPDQDQRRFAQLIVDSQGQPLRVFPDQNGVWRYPVQPHQVSPYYLEALLAYEDRWFYVHPGVNPLSLVRASWQWLRYGRPVSGGSTLTMQVARLIHPHSRTLLGKLYQMLRAVQLEWHLSKDEILALYINYAPFGGTLEGVQAASYGYLGKSAEQLSYAEAALLAVLPQRPSAWRPDRYPESARRARDKVLDRLTGLGVWESFVVEEARQETVMQRSELRPMLAPLLAQRLHAENPNSSVIKTTLRADYQSAVQNQVEDYIEALPDGTSAAVLLLNNVDLSVLVYQGSARFADASRSGFVDMVRAPRSPGSTLKPFVYGMALDAGLLHSESLLLDVPTDFSGYRPQNFSGGFTGAVSMTEALQRSLNVPAVQVLQALTPEVFYGRLLNAGLNLQLPSAAKPNLAVVLGGASVSLESLAGIYAALARGGQAGQPRWQPEQVQADRYLFSEQAAWVIHHSLRSPLGKSGQLYRRVNAWLPTIAYKTGTSYGNRDAWAVTVTADLTLAVWIGRPDGTALTHNTGRLSAVPLLSRLVHLLPVEQLSPPLQPPELEQAAICWPLGTRKAWQFDAQCHQVRTAWLVDGVAPPTLPDPLQTQLQTLLMNGAGVGSKPAANCQQPSSEQTASESTTLEGITLTDAEPAAFWPLSLEPWLPERWQRARLMPSLYTQCMGSMRTEGRLALQGILPDATLSALPGEATIPAIHLTVQGVQGMAHWFLNGRWLGSTDEKHEWGLVDPGLGNHRLAVMDSAGKSVQQRFTVVPAW